jgi:hypothetical protein
MVLDVFASTLGHGYNGYPESVHVLWGVLRRLRSRNLTLVFTVVSGEDMFVISLSFFFVFKSGEAL